MLKQLIRSIGLMVCILCVCASCSTKKTVYRIGFDPYWYQLDVGSASGSVSAFFSELLTLIGKKEGVYFETIITNWDAITLGLKSDKYDAILSTMTPRDFLSDTYTFSNLLLFSGPVLLVPYDMKRVGSLSQMGGKSVVVGNLSEEMLVIEQAPNVFVDYYTSIPEGLDEVVSQRYDGALVGRLPALTYVNNVYAGKIRIATAALNNAGVRLVTVKDSNSAVIKTVENGIKKLRSNGQFERLQKKWGLR